MLLIVLMSILLYPDKPDPIALRKNVPLPVCVPDKIGAGRGTARGTMRTDTKKFLAKKNKDFIVNRLRTSFRGKTKVRSTFVFSPESTSHPSGFGTDI